MPNVVRFALTSAKTLDVSGVGTFVDGILDVDANNLRLVSRARYLTPPYGAVEIGIVDSATPKPSLPAAPGPPSPDPYPQYLTADEVAGLGSVADGSVTAAKLAPDVPASLAAAPELRAAFVPTELVAV